MAQSASVIDDEVEPIKCGFLMKLANSGLVKRYIKYYFEIEDNQLSSELVWHSSETSKDSKGRVNLEEVTGIRRTIVTKTKTSMFASKGPPVDLRFELVCNDKVIEFAAITRKEKTEWLNTLSSTCDIVLEEEGDPNAAFAKVGNLMKLSGGGKRSKNWSTRYFTLRCSEPDPALTYYANENDQNAKGTILLSDVLELHSWSGSDGTTVPPLALRFEMVTRIRTYVFAVTESSEEKLSWLQELAKGCGVEISSEPAAAETATDIKDETVLFSGWLEKMGGSNGGFKNWKSRYFVLTEDRLLYFTDVRRIDLKGEIALSSIKTILPYSQVRLECGIEITTDDRVLVIASENEEDKQCWVNAIAGASKVTPEEIKFSKNFKGWLWVKGDKSNTFKRQFFVVADEKVKEKRFSLVNFNEVPPPPGEVPEVAAPTPAAEPSRKKVVYRLLMYNDEGCMEQKGGLAFKDITEILMQEYGALSTTASPYLNHRFELGCESNWVLAADTEADRVRWIEELQRIGEFTLNDKRPSKQQWDYEGALQTKKKVGGYKERYVRLRANEFTVFREESSQIIKDTIDVRQMFVESIKTKEVGGQFGFRLLAPDQSYSDWAATTEKVRDEWIDKVIAAGCQVSSGDPNVQERTRCAALMADGERFAIADKNIDFEGWVFIMKSSKQLLANSWKKRYARLHGCKLSWAHLKDSDDIDGIVCVDLRFQLKVYTQDTVGEKYWPFVISPLDDSLQEIVFAVGVEDIQESWVTNLESSLQYARSITSKQLEELSQTLPAAEVAVKTQSSEEDKARFQRAVDEIKSNVALKETQLKEESIVKFDTPRPKDGPSAKNTTDKKKKRTFGKRDTKGSQRGSSKRTSTMSSISDSEHGSSISSKRISDVSSILDSPVVSKPKKVREEVAEVMPTYDATPEAVPAAVYPVFEKPTAPPPRARPTSVCAPVGPRPSSLGLQVTDLQETGSVEEVKTDEVDATPAAPIVLVVSTGEGFTFQGRWKFDWLEIAESDLKSEFPELVLSQPPEVLAYRTDMGAEGSLVRCY